MSAQFDLLLELGVEELPAGAVAGMAQYFADELKKQLTDADLAPSEFKPSDVKVFHTPRRLAVLLRNIKSQQSDREVQKRGPALQVAFDEEGNPAKALLGFARSCGVAIEQLSRLKTDKGEWMVFNAHKPGESLSSVVATALPRIIKQMPMPKRMRWSDGQDEFLRPAQWLLALHGKEVLPVSVLGLQAGRVTRGHRFHASTPLTLANTDDYEKTLLQRGSVVPDFAARRDLIHQQVMRVASDVGGEVNIDQGLLDEVTALVEWPVALHGTFDSEFLALPKEALIQTMEENQRYFALFDNNGDLLPGFITVANIESSNPQTVREGNERVIRPRFKDIMFFWDKDRESTLLSHRHKLKTVLFQEKLGSVFDKSERLLVVSRFICAKTGADAAQCALAAELAKCDLVTDIVNELPKMQGIAGRYYAQIENLPDPVCQALEEQYYPKQAGGPIPAGDVGVVLALAEKADTLTGIFGINQKPTGARDPFGLRRASLGMLRILIEGSVDLDLAQLIAQATQSYGGKVQPDFQDDLLAYILERLKGYYHDKGASPDVVDAVMAKNLSNPLDIDRRIAAVADFRNTADAAALIAANKRIQNMLKKATSTVPLQVDPSLLLEQAEQSLATALARTAEQIEPHNAAGSYASAMSVTAKLREPVDQFFDAILVMTDDAAQRDNRLALLKQVGQLCSATADLSRLQPESQG